MSKDTEYRQSLRAVSRETGPTLWYVLRWTSLAIAVLVVIGLCVKATGILSRDIEREVTQHSRQYIETKVSMLNRLHNDWLSIEASIVELKIEEGNEELVQAKIAHQNSIIIRMRMEAGLIPEYEVSATVRAFLQARKVKR